MPPRKDKGFTSLPKFGYEFLPHTTDAYIEATGATLQEAFQFAGRALFDTLCDVNSVSSKKSEVVSFFGADEVALLHNWLETLLLRFEIEGMVFSEFKVESIEKSKESIHGVARIVGEPYDRRKHHPKVEVKAVTYHKMEVIREPDRTRVRFILDL